MDQEELKNSILVSLHQVAGPEHGLTLLGMALRLPGNSMDEIEQAVRDLMFEGMIRERAWGNLDEDSPKAGVLRTDPGWVSEMLDEIRDLPEVP